MAKQTKPDPLSDKQREIMEVVWEMGEASVVQVHEELSAYRDVARSTVRTMMERLRERGWLGHRVIGRTFFYSALIPQDVSLGDRVVEVVEKVCGGSPEKMMSALLKHRGLSAKEIARIEQMLVDARQSPKPKAKGKQK